MVAAGHDDAATGATPTDCCPKPRTKRMNIITSYLSSWRSCHCPRPKPAIVVKSSRRAFAGAGYMAADNVADAVHTCDEAQLTVVRWPMWLPICSRSPLPRALLGAKLRPLRGRERVSIAPRLAAAECSMDSASESGNSCARALCLHCALWRSAFLAISSGGIVRLFRPVGEVAANVQGVGVVGS